MRKFLKIITLAGMSTSIAACGLFNSSGPENVAMHFVHGMAKGDIQQVDKLVYWGPEIHNSAQPYALRLEEAKVNGYVMATYQRLQADGGLKEAKIVKNEHTLVNGVEHATIVIQLIPEKGAPRDTTLQMLRRDGKWFVSVD
ncbi:hypothetical protein HHS34_003010 [Acidithiobacillus montserratensis]|uniref:Uncharacterized protein n=1 Tax=Acidithiobacillus montserratensis TaxID=2729135 RepID=A0ACD5HIL9_9PROT|nr:hypothetical protein [Acidithiobacillus montserratensis]MBN2680611.1 hypothetical protein [Acidithiobacillaceae bacterium]MBU2747665.1 hypothetical protein [Acidithiobacillus montserratensis]